MGGCDSPGRYAVSRKSPVLTKGGEQSAKDEHTLSAYYFSMVNCTEKVAKCYHGRRMIVAMLRVSDICQSTNMAIVSGTSSCLFLPAIEYVQSCVMAT